MKTVLLVLRLAALSGCASGIKLTEADEVRCRNEGCHVHTQREMLDWARKIYNGGYRAGVKSI